MTINLTELAPGKTGVIVEVTGGHGLVNRLQSMGIRPGKKIKKISSHFLRGPHTIEIGQTKVAIGFGMASRILIEIKK